MTGLHVWVGGGGGSTGTGNYDASLSYSYNASTGMLTVNACTTGGTSSNSTTGSWVGRGSGYPKYKVYCVK